MVALIRDMVENPDAKPRADLYFGHAETAVPLMALLGLFDGAPLTADSFVLGKVKQLVVTILPGYRQTLYNPPKSAPQAVPMHKNSSLCRKYFIFTLQEKSRNE